MPESDLLPLLIDRLLTNSDATIAQLARMEAGTAQRLDRIDMRLTDGDRRMAHLDGRLNTVERRPSRSTTVQTIGSIEKLIKRWAAWLAPLAALWATGSLETAAKLMALLK
jgi:cob(I)alamin adenosyltransferase